MSSYQRGRQRARDELMSGQVSAATAAALAGIVTMADVARSLANEGQGDDAMLLGLILAAVEGELTDLGAGGER